MADADFVLTCIPIILDRILSFLPVVDLLRSQAVCKTWCKSSSNILSDRKRLVKSELFSYTEWDAETKSLTFKRTTKALQWNKNSRMYEEFLQWKNTWTVPPHFGICVCTSNETKNKNRHYEVENILRYWMPQKSKILVIGSIDSIVSVDRKKLNGELSIDDVKRCYNFLSLPNNSDSFSVEILNLKTDHDAEDHDLFCTNVKGALDHCDIKMVFVCIQPNQTMSISHNNTLSSLARRGVVVIGSLFDSPVVFNPFNSNANKSNAMQDIVFLCYKGKNVRSASVLIDSDVTTVSGLTIGLKKLEQTLKHFCQECPHDCKFRDFKGYCSSCNSQTLGIMIACCSRADSSLWYDPDEEESDDESCKPRNLEQDTFRTVIPNVPLLGTFGVGEIGASINLIGNTEIIDSYDDLFKGESTIFAVVRLK